MIPALLRKGVFHKAFSVCLEVFVLDWEVFLTEFQKCILIETVLSV